MYWVKAKITTVARVEVKIVKGTNLQALLRIAGNAIEARSGFISAEIFIDWREEKEKEDRNEGKVFDPYDLDGLSFG